MARINISRNGIATPYFWVNKDGIDRSHRPVFKKTTEGVTRMKGVFFDAVNKQMVREGK